MASLAEQLKSVKLKKPEGEIKDYSNPKLAGFMCEKDVENYQNKVLDVNTEVWMSILEEVTFPTRYCTISFDEAKLFVKVYEESFKDRDQDTFKDIKWKDHLSDDDKQTVNSIISRLQSVMDEYTSQDGYAFVKTSSRSAKDAPMYQDAFTALYKSELSNVEDSHLENTQIICLLKAAFQALKMSTAEQVVNTFMSSERIYQDMLLATKVPQRFHENFVVRKFVEIDIDMEFRGFVFEGKLVALSQYNYLIYSKRLADLKERVQKNILKFYSEVVRPKLQAAKFEDNFIIDFAICNLDSSMKIWVIEINPYLETTDGALFSWQHEKHILEGQEGFQFRITERPKPGAKAMLPQSIRKIIT